VIAFGDSGNDLSMADRVKMFVAMGNAEPAVLQCAGRIAPDVQEDGFAAVVADIFAS
jgi:hydroxymethylpyrimidine pyrophosphatase-like HAD family hydrolase